MSVKMTVNKKPVDDMTVDKMLINKIMFVDEMTAAKLLVDERTMGRMLTY
jgi:hypothetical protein